MVDPGKLPTCEIAASPAKGGAAVLSARCSTAPMAMSQRPFSTGSLDLRNGERAAEIGFADGKFTLALFERAQDLTDAGIGIAETMVREAQAFNAARIGTWPFPDYSFDKAFAVNVIYFWPRPVRPPSEMRRVLRPGGPSSVASALAISAGSPSFARAEFDFHRRDVDTLVALHRETGFGEVEAEAAPTRS